MGWRCHAYAGPSIIWRQSMPSLQYYHPCPVCGTPVCKTSYWLQFGHHCEVAGKQRFQKLIWASRSPLLLESSAIGTSMWVTLSSFSTLHLMFHCHHSLPLYFMIHFHHSLPFYFIPWRLILSTLYMHYTTIPKRAAIKLWTCQWSLVTNSMLTIKLYMALTNFFLL